MSGSRKVTPLTLPLSKHWIGGIDIDISQWESDHLVTIVSDLKLVEIATKLSEMHLCHVYLLNNVNIFHKI